MKRSLIAAPLLVLLLGGANSCSTENAVPAIATSVCEGWNTAELQLAPSIPTMSAAENGVLLGVKSVLSGTPAKPGLCRTPAPPQAMDVVKAGVDAGMTALAPLLAKYVK